MVFGRLHVSMDKRHVFMQYKKRFRHIHNHMKQLYAHQTYHKSFALIDSPTNQQNKYICMQLFIEQCISSIESLIIR